MLIKLIFLLTIPAVFIIGLIIIINLVFDIDDLKNCPNGPQASGQCQVADAVVAVSGGDTAARTDTAIQLYNAGWAKVLVFTGAAEDTSGPSNAQAMKAQALAAGVPARAIMIDAYSTDTRSNAINVNNISGLEGWKRIVLVTSPYHQRRASLEFNKVLGSKVTILNHSTPNDRGWVPDRWWLSLSDWYLAGSELIKIAFVEVISK